MNKMKPERKICPDCGRPLRVMHEELIWYASPINEGYSSEEKEYIGHCDNCHQDWSWRQATQWGDLMVTGLKRKFWG